MMGKFEFNGDILRLNGAWDYRASKSELKRLKSLKPSKIDLANLEHIDYSIAIFISKNLGEFELINSNDKFDKIFALVRDKGILGLAIYKPSKINSFEKIGKIIIDIRVNIINFCIFLGQFLFSLTFHRISPRHLRHLRHLRLKAIIIGLPNEINHRIYGN